MEAIRNKENMAVVARECQEEHPTKSQSRNATVPRINGDYFIQVSGEIESSLTKKLPQDFSWTENGIPGALSKLGEFHLDPQVWVHCGTVPRTSQNFNRENQKPNED